jgi:hypothetical protein
MSRGKYIELRTKSMILRDVGGYDIKKGESNPSIFEEFVGLVLATDNLPAVIWEPFAGHTGPSRNQDFAAGIDLRLISYDLIPCDKRVIASDSTITGPGMMVGGVFFHPPYFGTAPFSGDKRDLSLIGGWTDYLEALKKTALIIGLMTSDGGLVCAVGRDYRHGGKRIRLDLEYLKMFEKEGFEISGVLESEPDVALVFKKVGES